MPFCYEIIAINEASVDGLFDFLFFQSVVVYQTNRGLQCNLGFLSVAIHMHMNGVVLIQIEEETHSKSYQQCRHGRIFCKNRYKFLYLQVFGCIYTKKADIAAGCLILMVNVCIIPHCGQGEQTNLKLCSSWSAPYCCC